MMVWCHRDKITVRIKKNLRGGLVKLVYIINLESEKQGGFLGFGW